MLKVLRALPNHVKNQRILVHILCFILFSDLDEMLKTTYTVVDYKIGCKSWVLLPFITIPQMDWNGPFEYWNCPVFGSHCNSLIVFRLECKLRLKSINLIEQYANILSEKS